MCHATVGRLMMFVAIAFGLGCAPTGVVGGGVDRCVAKSSPVGGASAMIVNGSQTSDHLAVGIVRSRTTICTGTLVAPQVVLTAAHCIEPGTAYRFLFGATESTPEIAVRVREAVRMPAYQDGVFGNDVGYLILDQRITQVAPIPVNFTAVYPGLPFTMVGFGVTSAAEMGSGIKRTGSGAVQSLGEFVPSQWEFSFSPAGFCRGDSGGPAIATHGGVLSVVGVAANSDAGCSSIGHYERLDLAQAFIMQGLSTGAAAAPGEPIIPGVCENTCPFSFDGECDDGRPGAPYISCTLGTDCADCGLPPGHSPTEPPPSEPPPSEPPPGEPPSGQGDPQPSQPPADPPPSNPADPMSPAPMSPAPVPQAGCDDSCPFARDGECDDGGAGSLCWLCYRGTDCTDCGPRTDLPTDSL